MDIEEVREPTLLMLAALAPRARHGYALIEDVATLSEGRVRLKPGSLYAILGRLEREGLVRESGSEVVAGRHRRYYELTDVGTDALAAQVRRLEQLAAVGSSAVRRRRATPRPGAAPLTADLAGGAR